MYRLVPFAHADHLFDGICALQRCAERGRGAAHGVGALSAHSRRALQLRASDEKPIMNNNDRDHNACLSTSI